MEEFSSKMGFGVGMIKGLELTGNQALNKQRGEKDLNAKNALVPSTRIRDLKSTKDHNYLGLKEDSQVQTTLTNILLS